MAVSIDTVYQRVLVLANKEQRGYITPQEFNLLANQAQMEIFETYFVDIAKVNPSSGNMQEYSDPLTMLYKKIGEFEREEGNVWMTTNMVADGQYMNMPWDQIYKLGTVRVGNQQVELLNSKDFDAARACALTAPTLSRPTGYVSARGLSVFVSSTEFVIPATIESIYNVGLNISFITRPPRVQWAYIIINDKALYNDNISVDFELHATEEAELVYKILKLAGINLKAQEIVQAGQTLEQTNKQAKI